MESSYGQWFCNLMIQDQLSLVFWFCFFISLSVHVFCFWLFPLKSQDVVYRFRHHNYFQCVSDCKSLCPKHNETKQIESQSLHQRKDYCRAMEGDGWLMAPQTPNSPKGFSNILLKAKWRVVVSCCKLLGIRILCSCCCPCRSVMMFL